MSEIDKKTIAHLAELARLELTKKEEGELEKDLGKILGHFKELQSLSTEGVKPMAGGTRELNAFREDEERENTNRGAGVENLPESKDGFLKVPPVFE